MSASSGEETKRKPHPAESVLFLLLFPVHWWWCGFVMARMWTWFVVKSFGAPSIGSWDAASLTFMASLVIRGWGKPSDGSALVDLLARASQWALALGMGYLAHRMGGAS